jgi:hypothetical protein
MLLTKVMAQSVLDELEFLDLSAGIRPVRRDDEDDFDYVYHLPHANPATLIRRDPFQESHKLKKTQVAKSLARMSMASKHSINDIRSMLAEPPAANVVSVISQSLHRRHEPKSSAGVAHSTMGSANLGTSMMSVKSRFGRISTPTAMSVTNLLPPSGRGLGASSLSPRLSHVNPSVMRSRFTFNTDPNGKDVGDTSKDQSMMFEGEEDLITFDNLGSFRALPAAITQYIPANYIAVIGLVVMFASVVQVVESIIAN